MGAHSGYRGSRVFECTYAHGVTVGGIGGCRQKSKNGDTDRQPQPRHARVCGNLTKRSFVLARMLHTRMQEINLQLNNYFIDMLCFVDVYSVEFIDIQIVHATDDRKNYVTSHAQKYSEASYCECLQTCLE